MFTGFYRDRRVLVTGHTGFKGSWLSLWLKHLGAAVHGFGLGPPTDPNLHEVIGRGIFVSETRGDVRQLSDLKSAVADAAPEIVFHLAAQPLVRKSYQAPAETFETNALGTMNLLEAIRQLEVPCTVVVITSDKCYENRGWVYGYREDDSLGGDDVYSASKAVAELVVQAWRESFYNRQEKLGPVATARGGNVIGGGDYAEDRIVPDCVRALLDEKPIVLRNPAATRPWQHVFDCLSGYLWLGARLAQSGKNSPLSSGFNFGPGVRANLPVSILVDEVLKIWPGRWESDTQVVPATAPEAERLNLAIDKAAARLGWFPTWDFSEAIRQTVFWYYQRHVVKKVDMVEFSVGQIEAYTTAARSARQAWAAPAP